ncbi:hypothetical protein [Acidicapsa ligni]|uniref:hypothetical protein n=1 Tax=Acidicapsa ligni TaxID=542300 RepID=UPI0021E0DE59|nr:hypothetical protein [Acidicapsa ligni]
MSLSLAQAVILHTDVLVSVILCAVFFKPTLRKTYPRITAYLCVRAVTGVIIDFLFYGPLLASPSLYTKVHFVVYWASSMISAALLFLSCLDVYREAMRPLPGLARMGTVVFRWASLASILVTATSLTTVTSGPSIAVNIFTQIMRCVGTVELCLLAFLIISMKAIGLSPRNRPFGIAIGLGVMAASDCTQTFVMSMHPGLGAPIQLAVQGFEVAAIGLWLFYGALPEPARKPVTLPVESTIYRWNQIASALGHKGTQVTVQPAPSFFLVDVEKVVERAFVRTLNGKESES